MVLLLSHRVFWGWCGVGGGRGLFVFTIDDLLIHITTRDVHLQVYNQRTSFSIMLEIYQVDHSFLNESYRSLECFYYFTFMQIEFIGCKLTVQQECTCYHRSILTVRANCSPNKGTQGTSTTEPCV